MAKIIILNAPPGAGKDTIGGLVKDESPVPLRLLSFKQPMFEIALAILGPGKYQKFLLAYNDREQKEKPHDFLNGLSCREFMIWISEHVIKPRFGNGYFGKRFAEEAERGDIPVICTDGGFPDEVIELVRGGHEVKVCRLHRQGYTFEGDSRDYIRINGGAGIGYGEHDYILVAGEPMHTVKQIISDHLAK
uniref:ATP-binding protein n=1 Tax=Salmonella phage PMBT35 TaxID=3137287 RepID=A0AAU8BUL2_9VIRU